MASSRWSHIDSIRGLAALAVIYFHVAEVAYQNGFSLSWESLIFKVFTEYADLGKIAVVVFFAISGFVIPFSLLKPQATPLRNFAISRFFRLYPAYWLSLFLALLVFALLRNQYFGDEQILANITMLQQFLGQPNVMGVYWTLQIEIIFYVMSAAMFYVGILQRPSAVAAMSVLMLVAALAMAIARFMLHIKFPVALPLALSVMFWGISWRYWLVGHNGKKHSGVLPTTVALIVFVPIISLLAYNVDMGFAETWYRYTISYYIAMALFALLTTKVRITNPVTMQLGLISYSVYLLGPVAQAIVEKLLPYQSLAGYPVHIIIVLTMALTIVMALLAYAFIEVPFQRLGRKISERSATVAETI